MADQGDKITVGELQKWRDEAAQKIIQSLVLHTTEFKHKTGLSISSIYVNMIELIEIGQRRKNYEVGEVKIGVKIDN